jgi:predicted HD phosphohydrolase
LPSDREIRERIGEVAKMIDDLREAEPEGFGPPLSDTAENSSSTATDRFRDFEELLLPLENVKENLEIHPEGDVLYHSLQVFELARQNIPYDEEFLLASLLHDVGKAIDPRDHIAAGLEALDGLITERTAWLIEHHTAALSLRNGTLGLRFRRRLEAAESYDELMLVAECDLRGRAVGVPVPEVREALDYLRDLAVECGEYDQERSNPKTREEENDRQESTRQNIGDPCVFWMHCGGDSSGI